MIHQFRQLADTTPSYITVLETSLDSLTVPLFPPSVTTMSLQESNVVSNLVTSIMSHSNANCLTQTGLVHSMTMHVQSIDSMMLFLHLLNRS